MKKTILLIAAIFLVSGCAKPPTTAELNSADYGPKPEVYKEAIKAYYNSKLLDPYSSMFTFTEPRKGWSGPNTVYGWKVCGTVNGKNRMGGYAGAKPFYVLFRNGEIVKHHDDLSDNPFMKAIVEKKCK